MKPLDCYARVIGIVGHGKTVGIYVFEERNVIEKKLSVENGLLNPNNRNFDDILGPQ